MYCTKKVSLESFHKSVYKRCPQNVSTKSIKKKCPLKRPQKRVHKVSTKSVRKKCQKCPKIFSTKCVQKGVHKNCQKVSTKSFHITYPQKVSRTRFAKNVNKKCTQKWGGLGGGRGEAKMERVTLSSVFFYPPL